MAKNTKNRPAEVSPETTAVGTPKSPRATRRVRRGPASRAALLASEAAARTTPKLPNPGISGERSELNKKFVASARAHTSPRPAIANRSAGREDETLDPANDAVIVDDQIEAAFGQLTRGLEAIANSFSLFSAAIGQRRRLSLLKSVVDPTRAMLAWAFQIDSALGSGREGYGQGGRFLEAVYALAAETRGIECLCEEATDVRSMAGGRRRGGPER
jgi:hypothetical protein